jgi:hypothetical protein
MSPRFSGQLPSGAGYSSGRTGWLIHPPGFDGGPIQIDVYDAENGIERDNPEVPAAFQIFRIEVDPGSFTQSTFASGPTPSSNKRTPLGG